MFLLKNKISTFTMVYALFFKGLLSYGWNFQSIGKHTDFHQFNFLHEFKNGFPNNSTCNYNMCS